MMASGSKNNKPSTFTASCIKNPFSKPMTPPRNKHTVQDESAVRVGGRNSNRGQDDLRNKKYVGENNVAKIIKLIPGLCYIKKRLPESSRLLDPHNITMNHDLNTDSILIDISPSTKKVISGKSASRKTYCNRGSRQKKKSEFNPKEKTFSTNHTHMNTKSNFLNVNVSGPINLVVSGLKESNIKKIVTLSGAGMSTSAGIPDFRSPTMGIYDMLEKYNLPYAQAIFERRYFDKNPKPLFGLLKEMLAEDYKPTVAHYFVKLLEEKGLLLRHITQNVDGLERLAGLPQNKVVEAHGSVYGSRCIKCKTEYGLHWLRDRLVIQGKTIPHCQDPHCLGMVKPNIVLFGETLNPRFISSVKKDIPQCDLLIIFGTSLVVEPFASTVKKVSHSCPRIIVNNNPVGEHLGIVYKDSNVYKVKKKSILRDVFIQGTCDEGALHLAKLFKWESDLEALIQRCDPVTRHTRPSTTKNNKVGYTGEVGLYEQNMNETKQPNYPQTLKHDEIHEHSKNLDHDNQRDVLKKTVNADGKDPKSSVANRAVNMWKFITSRVLRQDIQ